MDTQIVTTTVTDFSVKLKSQINSSEILNIIGEVSNKKLSHGHIFFTLKDIGSQLNAVIWQTEVPNVENFENGDKILASGYLTIFPKTNTINLKVISVQFISKGTIQNDIELNKIKYEQLGYFDNKKPFPPIINKIGVITSVEGAAIQDFLYVLRKNNFNGNVIVMNTIMQGANCPISVATNLKAMDFFDLDVIVITRGGGSNEDLIGFSDPMVVEAIKEMKTFTVSAIGHEIDHTLSDYVADIRAPTPSVAADMVSKNYQNLNSNFGKTQASNLIDLICKKITEIENDVTEVEKLMDGYNDMCDNEKLSMNLIIGDILKNIKAKILSENDGSLQLLIQKYLKLESVNTEMCISYM